MHGAGGFLQDLAIVLCVAAVTTVAFQRMHLPVVIGYLLAGLLVGPHVPFPLFADLEQVQTLSELGVIVLLFSIGLEFSVRRLMRIGPSVGVTGTVEVALMMSLGYLAASALGWDPRTSFFAGGMVAISSTMIVARTFEEVRVERRISDLVLGVLIVEDLYALLILAVLTAVAAGAGLSAGAFVLSAAKLIGFLLVLVAVGLLVVPRALSYVARLGSRETTLVAAIGTCFAFALIGQAAGYSVALGAFIAGMLISESGEAHRIEHLVRPLRDVFGAVFFVSIGMLVDPRLLVEHAGAIGLFLVVVVVGKMVGVTLGALLVGHRTETAVRAGMSLAQIGEFSFLIAGVAVGLGPAGSVLPPIAVAVSVLTAFLTPFFVRHAQRVGPAVDRKLPRSLRTFLSLYATWLEGVRGGGADPEHRASPWAVVRRTVALLLVDASFVVAIVIGVSVGLPQLEHFMSGATGLSPLWTDVAVFLLACVAALPFAIGIFRCVRRIGELLAAQVLPGSTTGFDLAGAPRRAMLAGLQFAVLLMTALPMLAVTQPFLPALPGTGVILLALAVAGWALWRSAANLEGHVRAGSAMILEVLAKQSREARPSLEMVSELLPGLGTLTPVRIQTGDNAIGRSLQQINLHGHSGATILCISRGNEGTIAPTGEHTFQIDDVLTLAGTQQAITTARSVLSRGAKT